MDLNELISKYKQIAVERHRLHVENKDLIDEIRMHEQRYADLKKDYKRVEAIMFTCISIIAAYLATFGWIRWYHPLINLITGVK